MPNQKSKSMVAKGSTKMTSNDVPDYMKVPDKDLGSDNISSEDMSMPRVKICQKTSDRAKESIPGLKDGQIYNTLTNEVYGDNIIFVPLLFWSSKVWFSDDFKLLGTSYINIETGERTEFGNDLDFCHKNPDEAKDSYNYMLLTMAQVQDAIKSGDVPLPSIYSAMSVARGKAKQLNGKIKTNRMKHIPIYGQPVKMINSEQKFTKGSAFIPSFIFGNYKMITKPMFEMLAVVHEECKLLQQRSDIVLEDDDDVVVNEAPAKAAKGKSDVNPKPADDTDGFLEEGEKTEDKF